MYEQIDRAHLDSPAYAYVETEISNEYQGLRTRTPSSPPYSYVDSDKLNQMIAKKKPIEGAKGENNFASPQYFVLEHDNDNVYASTTSGNQQSESPRDDGQDSPRYVELECGVSKGASGSSGLSENDTEKYKELLYSPGMNTYESLVIDEDVI